LGDAGARHHKVGRAAARQGSDAWDRREVGGGAGVAATASGGEEQLGQTVGDVVRQGEASAGPGAAGQVLGRHVACLRAALERGGARHMGGRAAAARGRETEERGREVDEGGPSCQFQKYRDPSVMLK
jgi:hypothetical protein